LCLMMMMMMMMRTMINEGTMQVDHEDSRVHAEKTGFSQGTDNS